MTGERSCIVCGKPADIDRYCDPCRQADLERECAEQGLPLVVTDPDVLARMAAIGAHREQVAS